MKCKNCGKEIDDDSLFCEFCGAKVTSENSVEHPNQRFEIPKWVYAIVVILLGLIIWFFIPKSKPIILNETENEISISTGTENGHDFVDLGLSVKWATCNVGATNITDGGGVYSWGEITTKSSYDWSTYKYCEGDYNKLTRYNTDRNLGKDGFVDNLSIIESKDDIANIIWGGGWRMPTQTEFQELIDYCSWSWVTINGVEGYKISSMISGYKDRSIFIPSSSVGKYWSSSLDTDAPFNAYNLISNKDIHEVSSYLRCKGYYIRAVYPKEQEQQKQIKDNSSQSSIQKESGLIQEIPLSSITLSKTTLTLEEGATLTLTVKYTPTDASDKSATWKSTNTKVATVSSSGNVKAIKAGNAAIIASCGNKEAYCNVTVTAKSKSTQQTSKSSSTSANNSFGSSATGTINGHDYVDLGLSVKWATCNVGAFQPNGYGDYYSWGEINQKSSYSFEDYIFYNSTDQKISKYNRDNSIGLADNKTELEKRDDVASVKWGGDWRIPTLEEFSELKNNCTWIWTNIDGVNGYNVISNIEGYSDNSIFLPAAGIRVHEKLNLKGSDGSYWTSSLCYQNSYDARSFIFESDNNKIWEDHRFLGFSIRPVCP